MKPISMYLQSLSFKKFAMQLFAKSHFIRFKRLIYMYIASNDIIIITGLFED